MERVGWREFEQIVGSYFEDRLGKDLRERTVEIGQNHEHKFDLVSPDGEIVIECKSYTWTSGQNFPQAKISTANEALFFLSQVDAERKLLVMQDDYDDFGKSLIETYVSRYDGLMGQVEVWRYLVRPNEEDTVEQIRDAEGTRHIEDDQTQVNSLSGSSASSAKTTGKYGPLYKALQNRDRDTARFSFEEINSLLGDPLPDSAYKYRVWWNASGHSHAEGWESIGWTVSSLDLTEQFVVFEKHRESQ